MNVKLQMLQKVELQPEISQMWKQYRQEIII